MKKRLLCLLLMVTLLVGLMPAAFAEGNIVSYTVKSGDTIQSLHGIIECLLIDELCALFIIFTSKQFVFLLIMWLSRMD